MATTIIVVTYILANTAKYAINKYYDQKRREAEYDWAVCDADEE